MTYSILPPNSNDLEHLWIYAGEIEKKIQQKNHMEAFDELKSLARGFDYHSPTGLIQHAYTSLTNALPYLKEELLKEVYELVEYKLSHFPLKDEQCKLALALGDFTQKNSSFKSIYFYSQALRMGTEPQAA